MRETGKMANFDPKKFLSDNAIIIMIAVLAVIVGFVIKRMLVILSMHFV